MTRSRLSLVVGDWPEGDRDRWLAARATPGFLEADKPASRWSPARRRIVEQAYGQWLGFLDRNGVLDPSCAPGERVIETRLHAFVAELHGRVAPVSAAMMVGGLLRMLAVLEPEGDWVALGRVHGHLKRAAVPSRNKLARMVAATDLFELGLRLMDTCEDAAPHKAYVATRYRDGLLIALLIACPMRLGNLTGIVIGRHLIFDGQEYRLQLTAVEAKTGRPYHAAVPAELTPYMDRWLQTHRSRVQLIAGLGLEVERTGGHLWLDRGGRPMSSKAIRAQIEWRTRQAFRQAIWPHLFRDCAVTERIASAGSSPMSRTCTTG